MKRFRIIIIALCTALLLLSASCGNGGNADRETYVTAYKGASDKLTAAVTANADNGLKLLSERNDFLSSYEETNDKSEIKSANAFIYFLYLLYKNTDFPVSDSPTTFDCDYIVDGKVVQDNSVTMLSRVDKKNGKIIGDVIGESVWEFHTDHDEFYLHIEISFNFDNRTIGDFTSDMLNVKNGKLTSYNKTAFLYKNGKTYILKDNDEINGLYIKYISENYFDSFTAKLNGSVKLNKNFSDEYTESMNKFVM